MKPEPLYVLYYVLFRFYDQFKCDLTPMYFIKSILFLGSRWSVWVWVWQNFQKRTGTVRECAEQTAIVRRVCGCAKIGCTQILYYISYLIFEKIQWSIFLRCYISNGKKFTMVRFIWMLRQYYFHWKGEYTLIFFTSFGPLWFWWQSMNFHRKKIPGEPSWS